jgi:hypothetical protein
LRFDKIHWKGGNNEKVFNDALKGKNWKLQTRQESRIWISTGFYLFF